MKRLGAGLAGAFVLAGLSWLAVGARADPSGGATAFLEELSERSWWAPRTPLHEPLAGTTGSKAADCGTCHAEIYREWTMSTHAHAWTDRQFQGELQKDPEVAWICINCHTPAAGQQEELVAWAPEHGIRQVPRQENAEFDPRWQDEGIGCMSCHWRPEGIAAAHPDVQAPHATVYDPGLKEADLCLSCHQASVQLEDTLVCHFTTGEEWSQEAGAPRPCQGCHMPEVERAVAPGAPVRMTRRHSWPGSLIPKTDPPPDGWETLQDWLPGVEARIELPPSARPGERVKARLVLENVRAGHRVPTGDPERFLLLAARAEDATGQVVAGLTWRLGQRWVWWPSARKLHDDRLLPGEARARTLEFVMPEGGATLHLSLDHYRITAENAARHGLQGYPGHRRVLEQQAVVVADMAAPPRPR